MDEAKRELVQTWFRKALHDLDTAQTLSRHRALEDAQKIYAFVLSVLPKEVRP